MSEKKQENKSKYNMCPIRDIISRLSDKWSLLIVVTLSNNRSSMRFGEILKEIDDISQRMLTVTLRSLEADGLVKRRVYPEVPPRVDYQLTEMGHSLLSPLEGLVSWAQKNTEAIHKSRKKYKLKIK